MLKISKILLPVDYPNACFRVVHQAATLARHFHSEILMLHVATPASHTAGVPEDGADLARWDLLAEMVKACKKDPRTAIGTELDGLTVHQMVVKGNPADAIVRTAHEEKADLIMMPSHGFTFNQFLLGSVAAKVLHGTECPVWTGTHIEESPSPKFEIRNILCAVDFRPHCRNTVLWAQHVAAEFGARVTLADVTAAVDFSGPGGSYVNQKWKKELVADASQHIAGLQKDMAINADVFIGSGDVPTVLSQAAKQTKADLLVTGCRAYGETLRTRGYSIIRSVPTPVLSVGGP